MEFLYLGNIPQSLQGVNARETCTSFWTRREKIGEPPNLTPTSLRHGVLLYFSACRATGARHRPGTGPKPTPDRILV